MHTFVTEGEEVNVRVLKVDPHKRQIDLTLEGVKAEDYALSSGPDEHLSPFAVALQRAQRLKTCADGRSNQPGGSEGQPTGRAARARAATDAEEGQLGLRLEIGD
ncbi:MAG: hypothetical protein KatS3mg052_0382 [Candidatus Roseilinea sp.]|nr:MAG: hypothetical protein KatS3mg052_0382 [Candidatus Roseilinea sp.]